MVKTVRPNRQHLARGARDQGKVPEIGARALQIGGGAGDQGKGAEIRAGAVDRGKSTGDRGEVPEIRARVLKIKRGRQRSGQWHWRAG